jgi:hypothetical protein
MALRDAAERLTRAGHGELKARGQLHPDMLAAWRGTQLAAADMLASAADALAELSAPSVADADAVARYRRRAELLRDDA